MNNLFYIGDTPVDVNNQWDYENGFYITSHASRLAKSIAHYEIYKLSLGLPGDIVECGVYKGASLTRFATFRQILESEYSRKIIAFDIFGQFPRNENDDENDRSFIDEFEHAGGKGISEDELRRVLEYKNFNNIELVQGDIIKTVPDYYDRSPQAKISLLHIDVDVYEPTKVILETLYNRVVSGGIIIFDDYSTVNGETRAIDEFLSNSKVDAKINKLPFYKNPAYLVKP